MDTINSTLLPAKPTTQDIHQGALLFDEIANIAMRVQHLLLQVAVAENDETFGSVSELAESARLLVGQVGWAADLGAGKLNGTGCPSIKGGAERWLLSPSYNVVEGV